MNSITISRKLKKTDTMNEKNKENMDHLCSKAVRGDYEPTCDSKRAKSDSN